jgi:16S rRNA (cytosine1407-C5)-methyltransferase
MPRTFRLRPRPEDAGRVEDLLRAEGFDLQPDPCFPLARRAVHEPSPLGSSLAARFGLIYIQDRSSMLPAVCLDPHPGARVLDACASPGGKTGMAASLAGDAGFVLALEPNPSRLGTLRRNLERTGRLNTATLGARGESAVVPWERFALALLDPPCSGWGTEDKHPRVRELWKGGKIEPLIRLQRKLLRRAADRLPSGARFVYSTCTTNPGENEDQVAALLAETDVRLIPLDPPAGFELADPSRSEAEGALCVRGREGEQGFFAALLEKPGDRVPDREDPAELDLPGEPLGPEALDAGAMDPGGLPPGRLYDFNGSVHFIHEGARHLAGIRGWRGPLVGKRRGESFTPAPLFRRLLPREPGPGSLDVDEPAALRSVLSGASLDVGPGSGPVGLYFRGLPLGWLTRKGRRALWSGG